MNEKQYDNFKRLINFESRKALNKFIEAEIEAQPEKGKFLTSVHNSEFFQDFFTRGFIEGVDWMERNEKTSFVI